MDRGAVLCDILGAGVYSLAFNFNQLVFEVPAVVLGGVALFVGFLDEVAAFVVAKTVRLVFD